MTYSTHHVAPASAHSLHHDGVAEIRGPSEADDVEVLQVATLPLDIYHRLVKLVRINLQTKGAGDDNPVPARRTSHRLLGRCG
jgi:hypothetical protein